MAKTNKKSDNDDIKIKDPETLANSDDEEDDDEYEEDEDLDSETKDKKVKKKPKKRARRIKEELFHKYIPNHELLNDDEIDVLAQKGVIAENLPCIYISDPAIRHLEVKLGDVIKITRKSKSLGDVLYYRVVVNDK